MQDEVCGGLTALMQAHTSFPTCTLDGSILSKLVLDIVNIGVQPGVRILEHSVLAKELPPLVLLSPFHGIESRMKVGTQCLAGLGGQG